MAQTTVIFPTAAAVPAEVPIHSDGYSAVVLSADALASAETAPVYLLAGNTWLPVTNSDGVAQALSADTPSVMLAGGPTYGVTKDATAGACGIYVDYCHRAS